MPATPDDIRELRELLRWYRGRKSTVQFDRDRETKAIVAGLERALEYLEHPDRRINRALFILAALRQSMKRGDGGIWMVVDRDLQTWALEQAEAMFSPVKPADLRHA